MGFITKNANILLLFLILLSSVALVLATVFFQSNFDKINTEYNEKMAKLEEVSKKLKEYTTELTIKEEREKEMTEHYSAD